MRYRLKVWPPYYQAIVEEEKTFEVRQGLDRPYQKGDKLELHEWEPDKKEYTGRSLLVEVTWVMRGDFGIPPDVYVLGIKIWKALTVPSGATGV